MCIRDSYLAIQGNHYSLRLIPLLTIMVIVDIKLTSYTMTSQAWYILHIIIVHKLEDKETICTGHHVSHSTRLVSMIVLLSWHGT